MEFRPTQQSSYFYSYPYGKIYLAVHFNKGFFFQFVVDTKVMGLVPKYYLLTGDTRQVSISFRFPYVR